MSSSGLEGAFDGLARGFAVLLVLGIFGIWKLVEVIVWVVRNVRLSW